ncbi:alpha-glycosidase [Clostridium polyendosporum]|uniref:Alpha-glycosidase n=1 Tax=Clostridium polyendosporum TaxID=69208 RepID=A0A919VEH9_9CLOT|nr:glycoside hydrolase family 13 protein [Clostridium polyendosporum]GIM27450.1 alpha-glycosidase [Clostridium polyendosporum]
MNKHAIYHIKEAPYTYGIGEKTLALRLRAAKGDLKSCKIYYKDRYDWKTEFEVKELELVNTSNLFDYYECRIEVEEKRFRYFFELEDNDESICYLNERGLVTERPEEPNAFQFPYLCLADIYDEVNWAQEGIIYQIFPDRFCNGDKSNDPDGTLPWGEEVTEKTMFGGDIQGIINKVNYLKDLGVTMIYMTPIFMSKSNHKYDTKSYYEVDPHFGDNEKLRELIKRCHDAGIKVILDAVFNHSGKDFFAFEDVIDKGKKSKYKDWYFINSYPVDTEKVNYITFADNVANMPKLNTKNSKVKKYLLKIAKYWIEEIGIDGWRLDVCDEVDHVFWREFKKTVKKANKDAFIIGEIAHESGSFLKGDQLDSIMNYPFRECCLDFFARRNITAEELDHILAENRSSYMNSVNRQLLNLIDSHDTPRFLTECEDDKEKMKLAIVLQYTYIGVPYIYYGDEIGLAGGKDPECRRCMIWEEDKQDKELLDFYKKMNIMRKKYKTLVYGEYTNVYKKEMVLGFVRKHKDEEVLILINNSDDSFNYVTDIKGTVFNIFEEEEEIVDGRIELNPMSFKALKIK